jgi:hypothetical protein
MVVIRFYGPGMGVLNVHALQVWHSYTVLKSNEKKLFGEGG